MQPTCSLPTPTPGLTPIISMKKPQKRMLMPNLDQILGFSKLEVFRGPYCFVEGRTFLINCQRRISPNRGPNIDPRITHPLYIVGTVPRNAWRFGVYIKSLQLYLQPASEPLSPLIWSDFFFLTPCTSVSVVIALNTSYSLYNPISTLCLEGQGN